MLIAAAVPAPPASQRPPGLRASTFDGSYRETTPRLAPQPAPSGDSSLRGNLPT